MQAVRSSKAVGFINLSFFFHILYILYRFLSYNALSRPLTAHRLMRVSEPSATGDQSLQFPVALCPPFAAYWRRGVQPYYPTGVLRMAIFCAFGFNEPPFTCHLLPCSCGFFLCSDVLCVFSFFPALTLAQQPTVRVFNGRIEHTSYCRRQEHKLQGAPGGCRGHRKNLFAL